jgi:peptide/nickel transport system substrate-binding protein
VNFRPRWRLAARSLHRPSGPNNLDIHIHGVGTNRPGYEASWNCYDRLISHEHKDACPDGTVSYDRDKFNPNSPKT